MINKIFILFFTFYVTALYAQDVKPMSHEDMWTMKRVGSPVLSPDGQWVIFSVLDAAYNDKDQVNDIWIAPTNRSEAPRRLTSAKAGESGYTWSPDGKYIAFVAKRDGDEESQIYLLNMKSGGEAQKLTTISSGAGNPKWSNDSKGILFTSNVYPGCYTDSLQQARAKEKKDIKYKARVYETFPIRNWDKWNDEKVTHPFYQPIDSTKAINLFKDVTLANDINFKLNGIQWAGNDELVFSATIDATTAAYKDPVSHLFKLNIHGGDAVRLTKDSQYSYSSANASKDGKYLYCIRTKVETGIYSLGRIVRYDYPSMSNEVVYTEKTDRPINGFVVNGEEIIAGFEDQGRDVIHKITATQDQVLNKNKKGCYSSFAYENGVLVSTYESMTMPTEIVSINKNGLHDEITTFNKKKLETLDLQEAETFWTKTSKGKSIRSMLVKPAKFNASKKYPLLVLMHGGPAISYKENWGYRWNPYLLADTNLVIVMTDYTGSTGYGEQFAKDILNDPFRGPAIEINEAAADAIKRFSFIDGNIQAAGGASYGGHLANWMQATTKHYKCLISHAGLVNSISQWGTSDYIYGREVMNGGVPWGDSKLWKDQNPFFYADQFKTPMLLTVGELDYRVPVNNTIENWHIHQRLQIPSKLIVFPEENHWVLKGENSKFMYKEIKDWLVKWLK